jgi:hypothetical protein
MLMLGLELMILGLRYLRLISNMLLSRNDYEDKISIILKIQHACVLNLNTCVLICHA